MTTEDWGPLAARIEAWWSQPIFDEIRSAAYFELLQGYEIERVEEAFREMLSEGLQYLPSLSVVLAHLESSDAVRFEAMWAAVKAAMWKPNPELFLEPEYPLYLQFYVEQGRKEVLGKVDEANSYQMHLLRKAWEGLSREYSAEERRGRVRIALAARPLIPRSAQSKMRKLSAGKAILAETAVAAD